MNWKRVTEVVLLSEALRSNDYAEPPRAFITGFLDFRPNDGL
jgi:hypothetical protein